MRLIFRNLISCFLLITVSLSTNAQLLEGLQKNFQQYNDQVLQEKIYAHTDKNFYLAGEIVWFKLYNVDAGSIVPLNISKVAYVEILDKDNNAVLQAKVSLADGKGNGSIYVPGTFKNGNYKFRAYTGWMKNFSADIYFEKVITIVNPLTEFTDVAAKITNKPAIQFFAEGGNLLTGETNTVSFKATGADGKSLDINGVVINQRNDTVVRFQTLKFGMGSFLFTPDANSTYKAVVRLGRTDALISDLPPIATNGYAMHLTIGDKLDLKISSHGDSEPLYVFIHSGHQVVSAQSIVTDANGNATVSIDRSKLGKGINHITLFNSARQPVCERLVFNRPEMLTIRAQAQPQYKLRSPVVIPISANSIGATSVANMSVTVFKADSLNNADDADIASYMWLTSELKGNIESPNYYFDVITSETDKALDNLLLVQGWSRFKWDDVLTNKQKFTYLPEYDGHLVTAQITNWQGKPAPKIAAYMGITGKRVQVYGAIADSTGRLLFNTKELYGPGEIVVQTDTEIDSTYRISVHSPFAEQYTKTALPVFNLDKQWQKSLETTSLNMQVQNIYAADKLKRYIDPAVDSTAYFYSGYKRYLLDQYTRFITMEEVLREYIAEITLSYSKKRLHFNVLKEGNFSRDQPIVILDGVPIFNRDRILEIDPLKIRELDMGANPVYFGPIYSNGVISLHSYKNDMAGFDIDPKAVVLDYEGMQLQREFYSPAYETVEQQKSRLPDFRTVLYWAPDVNTDAQGNAKVSFYTSDKAGKYIAVFQGYAADGKVGSYGLKFDVSK